MAANIRIVLKSGKDQSLMRKHPWVFSGAIKKMYGNPAEGDLVDVYNNKDEFLATGHYQPGSIAVRVLSFLPTEINEEFWFQRINDAYQYRKNLGLTDSMDTNVYRLTHAEGDNLPGLIVDNYDGNMVIQVHSAGIYRNLEMIKKVLLKVMEKQILSIFDKSETTMPHKGPFNVKNRHLMGDHTQGIVKESGLHFKVNWVEGQKTGFFIDQRENRKLVMQLASGRQVLNMFSYTGGFSVYALAGGAQTVHSVDSSTTAIDLLNENIQLNFKDANHQAFSVDAFKYFDISNNLYDFIILDPPAFAKHQNVLHNALQGYKRLNQQALERIQPGGILFTFSCSQVVSKENFRKSVFVAAANAGRNVRILYQLSQPIDHPVNIYHPEGEYLKGLVLYVE